VEAKQQLVSAAEKLSASVAEQFAAVVVMLFVVVEQFAAPEELLQEQGKLLPLVHPEREMFLH